MSWERFCNWLEAKPWRWHYRAIWEGIEGDPPPWRRLWWTITFPHVHHDEDDWREAHDRVAEQLAAAIDDYSWLLGALMRAHKALDVGHDHTAETWADRERFGRR